MTFNLAAVLLTCILGSRPHGGFAAAGGFASDSRSRRGFVWSEEQVGSAKAGEGSAKGKGLRRGLVSRNDFGKPSPGEGKHRLL